MLIPMSSRKIKSSGDLCNYKVSSMELPASSVDGSRVDVVSGPFSSLNSVCLVLHNLHPFGILQATSSATVTLSRFQLLTPDPGHRNLPMGTPRGKDGKEGKVSLPEPAFPGTSELKSQGEW